MRNIWTLLLLSLAITVDGASRGDSCTLRNGQQGICRRRRYCRSAREDWDNHRIRPEFCDGNRQLICCGGRSSFKSRNNVVAERTSGYGWKSEKKCREYSKWKFSPVATFDVQRVAGQCGIAIEPTIVGGQDAGPLEFPHMAHLGYTKGSETKWDCGASLISEQFLLTAAHCLHHPEDFQLRFAKLGTGERRSQIRVRITKEIPHPEYNHPLKYNDIALLQLENPIRRFSDYLRPACLHHEKEFSKTEAVASGWGLTTDRGERSEVLLKVTLPLMETSQCSATYPRSLKLQNGLDENTMICAGGVEIKKDTCQGDSGGPLQIGQREPCVYHIIGVTSFGGPCGYTPGIYARVSNYIPWLESILWPDL